jgi:hypothetical protein
LIFRFNFCMFSFKPIFYNKSFKLDLSSSTFIGKYVQPKNFKQSCNCSFTLAFRDDILRKY